MGEAQLNGLVMLYINWDIACDVDAVVVKFAKQNRRRLQLCTPLHTDEED